MKYWLKFRIALSRWIYTPPAPVVPAHWKRLDIPRGTEEQLRALLLLPHDAEIEIVASSTEDRHLAAARAGFTIPPHSLRLTEYPPSRLDQMMGRPGARIFDYSGHLPNDKDDTWPPTGEDPLAGEADDINAGGNSARPRKRK